METVLSSQYKSASVMDASRLGEWAPPFVVWITISIEPTRDSNPFLTHFSNPLHLQASSHAGFFTCKLLPCGSHHLGPPPPKMTTTSAKASNTVPRPRSRHAIVRSEHVPAARRFHSFLVLQLTCHLQTSAVCPSSHPAPPP